MLQLIESLETRALYSASPALTPKQQQDIAKLLTDLQAIHFKSDVTPAQKQAFVADLKAVSAVATKPDPATVATLQTDVLAARADGKITTAEKALIATDITAILNSAHVPVSLAKQTAADFKTIVLASNITRADVLTIFSDCKVLYADFGH